MKRFFKDYGQVISFSIILLGATVTFATMMTKFDIKITNLECKSREHSANFKESTTCINDINKKLSNIEGKIDMLIRKD